MFQLGGIFILFSVIGSLEAWKPIPANKAKYKNIPDVLGFGLGAFREPLSDEDLPRDQIHSIYKFGFCHTDAIRKQFLIKTANLTISSWQSTQTEYFYLLQDKHTIRTVLQCIVMKIMVPRKYLFRRSRLPLYYCQGILYIVALEIYQRIEMHEFYIGRNLNMPTTFVFEFYHPPYYTSHDEE